MKPTTLQISEAHIGDEATLADAQRVVVLMQANGWPVIYGDAPWRFTEDTERPLFDMNFSWALAVVEAEKRPFDAKTMLGLFWQRFLLNEVLRPYQAQLLSGDTHTPEYMTWLLETPANVMTKSLKPETKDAPKG